MTDENSVENATSPRKNLDLMDRGFGKTAPNSQ